MEEKKRRIAKSEPLFIEEEPKNTQVEKKEITISNIPLGYVEVKLDSLGKLDAPAILHFRNYLMEEVLELASAASNEDTFIDILIRCLNRMVFEEFDCALLHEKELEEIELTLFASFWASTITNKPYYIDNTITDLALKNDSKNIGYAAIPIKNIKTKVINKDFKEPIKIQVGEKIVKFKLPRIKNILEAKEYVNKKYYIQDREISDIKNALIKKEKVSFEDQKKYDTYEQERSLEFLKAFQSGVIYAVNNKKLEMIEEKLEAYKTMDLVFWQEYQKVTESIEFGVDPEVTFFSVEAKKELTRRFSFQPLDFIPSMELPGNTTAIVSFGD